MNFKLFLVILFMILMITFMCSKQNKKKKNIISEVKNKEQFDNTNWTFIDTGGETDVQYHYLNCQRIFNKRSKFQKIQVYKHPTLGNILVIDKDLQLTEHDERNYHEMMVHVPLNYIPDAKNILIIGGGDGGTLTQVLKHKNLKTIINVDIDKMVIDVAKKYFPKMGKSFNNNRVQLIIDDGAKLVKKYANNPSYHGFFDIIIRDNTDYGQSETLFKDDFYEDCLKIMKEYSILVFNYNSLGWERKRSSISSSKQLKKDLGQFFKYTSIFQLYQPTFHSGHYSHAFLSNKINPTNSPIDWYAFYNKKLKTKYYNKNVHIGSFALPPRLEDKSIRKPTERLGVHILVDISDANYETLNNKSLIGAFFDACLDTYALQELKRIDHQFTPQGITMISLLSTSHMSIHTWPEKGTACLDIFTCSDFRFMNKGLYDIKNIIERFFKTNQIRLKTEDREF